MKKKLLLVLMIGFLFVINVTFAYMMLTFETNKITVKVGQLDSGIATLSEMQPDYVLIPFDSISTKTNERKKLDYRLIVDGGASGYYFISHNLPPQFTVTTDNAQATFQTGRAYTISVVMNEPVEQFQEFYITIEFIA